MATATTAIEENRDTHSPKQKTKRNTAHLRDQILDFKKKFDTCASSPHINAKHHDVPAQHENLRQAQYHANLDYDSAPLQLA